MPNGASMKDCIFRAHDERFFEIIGASPEIWRLAKTEYDFAHEVSARQSHVALVICILLSPGPMHSYSCTSKSKPALRL